MAHWLNIDQIKAALRRSVALLGFHHVLMILLALANLFIFLLLLGCSTPALRYIYVLSYSYRHSSPTVSGANTNANLTSALLQLSQDAHLEVRAGYFSICASVSSDSTWKCDDNAQNLRRKIGNPGDPFDLIGNAHHFRNTVIFPGLLIITLVLMLVAFLGFYTFPGWHEEVDDNGSEIEVKPFPSRAISNICIAFTTLSVFFLLISAVWQHVAAATSKDAVEFAMKSNIHVSLGAAAVVFVWIPFTLSFITLIGIVIMVLSIV